MFHFASICIPSIANSHATLSVFIFIREKKRYDGLSFLNIHALQFHHQFVSLETSASLNSFTYFFQCFSCSLQDDIVIDIDRCPASNLLSPHIDRHIFPFKLYCVPIDNICCSARIFANIDFCRQRTLSHSQ